MHWEELGGTRELVWRGREAGAWTVAVNHKRDVGTGACPWLRRIAVALEMVYALSAELSTLPSKQSVTGPI